LWLPTQFAHALRYKTSACFYSPESLEDKAKPSLVRLAQMKHKSKLYILLACSIFLTLVMLEVALFLGERYLGWNYFNLLRQKTSEAFYYHHLKVAMPQTPFAHFDNLLGWRNFKEKPIRRSFEESINSQRWRSQTDYQRKKTKPRIALIGDSFTYGWKVDDTETLSHHLGKLVGSHYEVMNFAARGYGLDQMALVATKIIPDYEPDIVVLAFIGQDLERSCQSFHFNTAKPYFEMDGSGVHLKGVPVPSPFDNYKKHRGWSQKIKDTLITWITRSRIVCLVGELVLIPSHKRCLEKLNPTILHYVEQRLSPHQHLLLVHMDGKLPEHFSQALSKLKAPYLSIPLVEKQESLPSSTLRHEDGHPKGPLNKIFAKAIYKKLKEQRWLE